jgi:hypothetical protein
MTISLWLFYIYIYIHLSVLNCIDSCSIYKQLLVIHVLIYIILVIFIIYIWTVTSLDIYFSLGIIHFHEKEASLICSTFFLQWFTCIEWVIESYYIHIQCLLTVVCIQKCVYVIHDRIFVYILWLYTTNAIYVFITIASTIEQSWMTWCMIQ